MKSLIKIFVVFGLLLFVTASSFAQVSGIVFRDFNANGVRENTVTFMEPVVPGVTVTAYKADGSVAGTQTSGVNGAYTFTGLTLPLRVEFSGIQNGDFTAPAGTTNGTSVQFVSANSTTTNFGINYPQNYCNPVPADIKMVVTCFVNGDPLITTGAAKESKDGSAIASQTYGVSGGPTSTVDPNSISPAPNKIAAAGEVGSVFGLAWDRTNKKMYSTAFVRRYVGLGSLGSGGIYVTDMSTGTPVSSPFINLTTLGVSTGTIPSNVARGLKPTIGQPSNDPTGFDGVGTIGLGDIDISDDGKTLFFVNLFDKKVYSLLIDSDNNPATAPTAADLKSFAIAPVACTDGNYRPFALKFHRNKVFLGGVCDGDDGTPSSDKDDPANKNMFGFVHQYDPANIAAAPVQVLTFPLSATFPFGATDYPHTGLFGGNCGFVTSGWHTWRTGAYPPSLNPCGDNGDTYQWPTPILMDIEFDYDNSMILGIGDRMGFQLGNQNYGLTGTTQRSGVAGGDIIRAYPSAANAWTLESNGDKDGSGPYVATADQKNRNEGPGGGEFYYQDYAPGFHNEIALGALAFYPGSDKLVFTAVDPPVKIFTNGVSYISNSTGKIDNNDVGYAFFFTPKIVGREGFSKASGLGDIELTCIPAPIEIGNRVWIDTDLDGIQDADEAGVDGVEIELVQGGSVVGTALTANGGQWYFNATNVTGGLMTNTDYTIRVKTPLNTGPLAGYPSYTLKDAATGGIQDMGDSDVDTNGTITYRTGSFGENNHTFDIGVTATQATPCPSPNCGTVTVIKD